MRKNALIVVLAALPAAALANGYNVPNVNARDLALADSARAAQNSAAAVYANPSALAGVEGLNLSLGISFLDLRTSWTGVPNPEAANAGIPANGSASTNFHPVPPPALFVSYGGKINDHGWGVGVGWNIVAGGNSFWPDNWDGRFRVISVDRRVHGLYLTGGYEVLKQLKLGGGLIYYRTTEDLKQAVNFVGSEGGAELVASGGAFSFDLSALITPIEDVPFTIAVDYKHQGVQHLTGRVHYTDVPPALATNPQLQDQAVTHELTIPNALNIGLAYRALPKWLFTFGFTFDRYTVYQSDVFQGELGASVVVPRNYSNGYTFRFGAEHDLLPQLKVRGGFLLDHSGLDTNALSPTLPDSSAWAAAVGGTWAFTPDIGVDATVWYGHLNEQTATNTGPAPQAFPGTYSSHVFIYALALTWRDPLHLGH
jgi:long-chain fatty acid transport protein